MSFLDDIGIGDLEYTNRNFLNDTEDPHGRMQIMSDLQGQHGDAMSRGSEGRSILGNFGTAILGGYFSSGGDFGGYTGFNGSQLGNYMNMGKMGGGSLYNMRGMFDGGGQQPQQPFYSNPFSPPQQQPQNAPWQQAHFTNNSFTPWLQNTQGALHPQNLNQPWQRMFSPGTGYF